MRGCNKQQVASVSTRRRRRCSQEAIASRKREQEANRAELGDIMARGLHSGVHPLERPEVCACVYAGVGAGVGAGG